jgi:hypothetical protein
LVFDSEEPTELARSPKRSSAQAEIVAPAMKIYLLVDRRGFLLLADRSRTSKTAIVQKPFLSIFKSPGSSDPGFLRIF